MIVSLSLVFGLIFFWGAVLILVDSKKEGWDVAIVGILLIGVGGVGLAGMVWGDSEVMTNDWYDIPYSEYCNNTGRSLYVSATNRYCCDVGVSNETIFYDNCTEIIRGGKVV